MTGRQETQKKRGILQEDPTVALVSYGVASGKDGNI